MAHLLSIQNISLHYPNRVLLEDVTLGLNDGDRIGVVGRNGDGKSTLLRIIANQLEPNSGQVTYRSDLSVGMLKQSDDAPAGMTVSKSIVGNRPEHEWAADAKVRNVLSGLVSDLPGTARLSELSGGQRRRVALAKLLVGDWDVLLLDEPTNHLDLAGVNWLAEHLKTRWSTKRGAVVVVTHDRWFLDEISNQTWEVHDGIVEPFEGGYAAYVLQRVERDRQANVLEQKRQNLMRKELAWLRRGAPARTAKPKFRIDAANELIADVPPLRNQFELMKLATARQGKDVVELIEAGFSYAESPVLTQIELKLGPGDRIGLLGRNGVGKSTMLSLISGEAQATSGRVKFGKTVKIAVLSQQLDELSEFAEDRVSDVLGRYKTDYKAGDKEYSPAQLLGRLGFDPYQFSTRVRDLSGGQKRRLQFLLILLDEPNLLILDEPTNDLDTDMLAAMEDLLDSWPGTLVVVSHDRYLLERVTDHQYALLNTGLRHLPGGVDEYLRLLANDTKPMKSTNTVGSAISDSAGNSAGDSAGDSAKGATCSSTSDVIVTGAAAAQVVLSGAERRAAEKEQAAIDRKLTKLNTQILAKHEEIATYDQSDYTGLGSLSAELAELESQTSDLENRWLEISELLG